MSKITSCPVCRGEIHAIAGRCKHCKADLVELRERASRLARAQAIGATVPPTPRFGLFAQGARPMTAPPPFDAAPTVRDPAPPSWAQAPRATEPPPIHGEAESPGGPGHEVVAAEVPAHEPTTAEMEAAYDPSQFAPAGPAFPGSGPAAFRGRPFPGVIPDPPPGGTPPYGIGFAPPRGRRVSSWSRRWPLLVSAVALLAIGISVGVLAERWRQKKARPQAAAERHSSLSRSPMQVPDHMPQPLVPGPGEPRIVPDPPADRSPDPPTDPPRAVPTDPDPPAGDTSDPDPGSDDPSNPGSRFSPPPSGQSGSPTGDPTGFRTFSVALTESLCQKLTQCGLLDDSSQSMCQVLAKELDPDDAAEKVARGECSFNQGAADACLRAVADLSCDGGAGDRMLAWLMAPNRVGQCAEAYVCP
jgi:hypothetical protein